MTKGNTLTIGIDLGDEYSEVCVLDLEGEVSEEGRVKTSEAALHRRFARLEPCRTVLEVGTHSPWVSRLLQSLGHKCLVANPSALHKKGRKKSDKVDAEKLARWGRSDPEMLAPIQHAGLPGCKRRGRRSALRSMGAGRHWPLVPPLCARRG